MSEQLKYWTLSKKIALIEYHARQNKYKTLGLHPIPTLQVSEHNAKAAIKMLILLRALEQSPYSREPWTLRDTNKELVLDTAPKDTFKKQPFVVEVQYGDNADDTVIYTQWQYIYYMDLDSKIDKTEGKVDINGLCYDDKYGERVYFKLFAEESTQFGSNLWTVRYKHTTISSIVSSSTDFRPGSRRPTSATTIDSGAGEATSGTGGAADTQERPSSTTTETAGRRRRRRRSGEQQGESSPAKRSRLGAAPTPGEVGQGHTTLPRTGLGRLGRLQAEARDPPALIVTGPPNCLKCWRFRLKKYSELYKTCSTVWKWVTTTSTAEHKMLVVFNSESQRQSFVHSVKFPKTCTFVYAALEAL